MSLLFLISSEPSFGYVQGTVSMFMHEEIAESMTDSAEDIEPSAALITQNKSFKIQILWEPTKIRPNEIVKFEIKFLNYITEQPVSSIYYNFVVMKDNQIIKELRNSFSMDGVATHTVEFPSSGSFSVMVDVIGVGEFPVPISESVSLDLKVVPEFPLSSVIVMASVVSIMILLTRFTVMNRRGALGS